MNVANVAKSFLEFYLVNRNMGFDTLRFFSEVDREFHCYICTLVLENPVQTPCEHNFCRHCISEWLTVKQLCPVDSEPLSTSNLKPLNRSLRNLWNKLKIKCDFESEGCKEVVELEQFQGHLTTCEYGTITCDKGCNLQMTRREYRANNCVYHFKERVSKYENQLSPEIRLVLSNQSAYNECLQDENIKLKEENTKIEGLQQQLKNVDFISKSKYAQPIEWSFRKNMNIDTNLPNILEHKDIDVKTSEAQLGYFLKPKNNSFKVEILAGSETGSKINIGLACKGYTFGCPPYIYFYNEGIARFDIYPTTIHRLPRIADGDIVECGIQFPANFVLGYQNEVTVYFIVNGEYKEGKVKMPKYGFYPTICFDLDEGNITKPKIKFLRN